MKVQPNLAVADRVLVKMQPGARADQLAAMLARAKARGSRPLGHGIYVVELPENSDVRMASAALRTAPGVVATDLDLIMYPALIPNDTRYPDQYHLPLIAAPAGWDVTTGTPNVVIAIIDSGVYLAHPDLVPKIWVNADETAGNHRDDDGNGYIDDVNGWDFYDNNNNPNPSPNGLDDDGNLEPDEQVNHGTLVAGLAAALGNDNYGAAGVCWGATIMPLQIFPDDGGTAVSTVIEGIDYAVANGADVINLSIGGGYTEMFTDPLTAAYNAGIVVVVAAGNEGELLTDSPSTWKSPVCNDGSNVWSENHLIGVGATDRNDRKSSYSNYDGSTASFVEIMAPGDALFGPAAYFPEFAGFNRYFQTNSGSSFSCPVVTGVVGLVLTQNPGFTPTQVIQRIRASGDDIDSLNPGFGGKLGGGRINVARALGVTLPPAPARDLIAADTSGDDGGSITLTWRTSPDDGAGSDKVQSYYVFRRAGGTGAFTRIATRARGTETYIDRGVTDGTDYYYKIRTTDGTLTSDTGIVGPVQSLNDAAPAVAIGVTAADRPSDSGGAIIVRWDAYTAPADFGGFAIYRSTNSFTSTVGMTPLAVLPEATTTSYLDDAAATGINYYYAVGVRDTADNEAQALHGVGPVQAYSNDAVTFAAGLHFLGPAAVPADGDPASFFGLAPGSFPYCRWLPDARGYSYDSGARPLPEALQMQLGRGFWVKLPAPTTVRPDGLSAPAGDHHLDLTPGWHQIANPFFATISFDEATVTYDGATMDLLSADGQGIMAAFAWTYNNAEGIYELAYPALGGEPKLIAPWQGLWVLVYKDCRLTLSRPLGTAGVTMRTAAAARPKPAWQVNWAVPLALRSNSGRDAACYVGVASRQILVPKPPPPGDAAVLTVSSPAGQRQGQYAVALAQPGVNDIIWNLRIEKMHPGQTIQVLASDLSRLPPQSVALLEDLATNQTVYLRTASEYSFTPRAGETSRALRLTITQRADKPLMLQAVSAQQLRGGAAQVMFALTAPASVDVTVMNMAGRVVRLVEEGKPRTAGNNVVLWDGRTQLGTKAPPGMYLTQVVARTQSGQIVKAVSTLRIAP